jgi:hypothetical protein
MEFVEAREKYRLYRTLEAGWAGYDEPVPAEASLISGECFMSLAEAIPGVRAPEAILDHEGIPGLIWAKEVAGEDYLSFAFYPNGEIVFYVRWKKDGSSAAGTFRVESKPDLDDAFMLVKTVGFDASKRVDA